MRLRELKVLIARRLVGHLPVINICGQPFFVDIRAQQLRSVADYGKYLPFYLMHPDPMTHGRRFLYDPKAIELYAPLDSDFGVPDTLVLVHLPFELMMDPIGVAKMNGYDMDLALKMYPLQKELKAIVTELDTDTTFYFIQLFTAKVSPGGFAGERDCCQKEGRNGKVACCHHCGRQF
ncbi:hypothetical protein SAMN05192529_10949 [Arachidicoccus rhizosphaerae]|uniref:Uncharacterized protein n=1 Tax=Arachidicoccus rhizosphaerae TaxID=551991 RepID=A0A1H3YU61_9BACT|nr:hypothetical protein [Arachidicoccus rhizosphaerae]SEA14947.1 hypothetical protein SAMN05192529_10949 [Arachidicoccus rhizosphaerae]